MRPSKSVNIADNTCTNRPILLYVATIDRPVLFSVFLNTYIWIYLVVKYIYNTSNHPHLCFNLLQMNIWSWYDTTYATCTVVENILYFTIRYITLFIFWVLSDNKALYPCWLLQLLDKRQCFSNGHTNKAIYAAHKEEWHMIISYLTI